MIAAVAVVGLAGAAIATAAFAPQSATRVAVQTSAKLSTANFAIKNMTCATCPITVRRAMERVDGVHEVTIDFEAKTATARFDPKRTTAIAIAAASTNAGYPAQSIGGDRL